MRCKIFLLQSIKWKIYSTAVRLNTRRVMRRNMQLHLSSGSPTQDLPIPCKFPGGWSLTSSYSSVRLTRMNSEALLACLWITSHLSALDLDRVARGEAVPFVLSIPFLVNYSGKRPFPLFLWKWASRLYLVRRIDFHQISIIVTCKLSTRAEHALYWPSRRRRS